MKTRFLHVFAFKELDIHKPAAQINTI